MQALYELIKGYLSKERCWTAQGTIIAQGGSGVTPDRKVVLQQNLEPGYYTLQFWTQDPPGVLASFRAKAEILWTVKGGPIRRVIDVYNGASISGAALGINCEVTDASPVGVGPQVPYDVTINLVKGTRPTFGGSQPPVLTPRDVIGGNTPPYLILSQSSIDVTVPENSGINSVMIMATQEYPGAVNTIPITNGDLEVFFMNSASATFFGSVNYDGFQKFVPVPAGTKVLRITNNSFGATAQAFRVTPIFGVEG